MTMRTSSRTVTFVRPFILSGIDGPQPPGTYTVETDEELLDGSSPPVYRRIATMIRLPGRPGSGELVQVVTVDPDELAAALLRDGAAPPAPPPRPPAAAGAAASARAEAQTGEAPGPQAPRPLDRLLDGWRYWAATNPRAPAWIVAIVAGILFAAFIVAW
ncbi:MAG: hypothetical protein JF625_17500 [Inquilinus limosus]|uniref:Uncharacterized protein n=1 Tax=Inquilinus limosus TaxID=171674 RepID=A0A952FKX8_9PROT|nr:hypothetical protein [Inquilinus limosus]